ncbi:MAG: formylglycine-generating enzyme family protein [Proteobacteria bacterium]|nr:formylglycine-generating enzyme family protein [Pseudomonadota bacterium]
MSELAGFISALKAADIDLSGREVADVLWLAMQMTRATTNASPGRAALAPSAAKPGQANTSGDQTAEREKPSSEGLSDANAAPGAEVHPTGASKAPAISIRAPGARALPTSLAFMRALRPLRQLIPSPGRWQLDESATVEWIAETGLWIPQFQPIRQPRFGINFVLDEGRSMGIWQHVAHDIQGILERHRGLRDVQCFGLDSGHRDRLIFRAGLPRPGVKRRLAHESDVVGGSGQRLVLIMSDCVDPVWYGRGLTARLARWANRSQVSLLHVLPERLWLRTALRRFEFVDIRAAKPACINRELLVQRAPYQNESPQAAPPIPVLTLVPSDVAQWVQTVVGHSETGIPAIVLAESPAQNSTEQPVAASRRQPGHDGQAEPIVKQRIDQFYMVASPAAIRLAEALSAAPLSWPTMRLIMETLVPEATMVDLAEFILSGLVSQSIADRQNPGASDVQYRFIDGAAELLSARTPAPIHLRALSLFMEQHLGQPIDFRALLRDPSQVDSLPWRPESGPIAVFSAQTLRRMGGRCAAIAARLERLGPTHEHVSVATSLEDAINAKSELGEFAPAPQVRPNQSLGIVHTALEDVAPMRFVGLTGGTFTMGSPASEPGRGDDETEREVTVYGFEIAEAVVTQTQWQAVMGSNPSYKFENSGDTDEHPVQNISWYDAIEFLNKLSQREGLPECYEMSGTRVTLHKSCRGYRLPTEAEWEYACRAGSQTAYGRGVDASALGEYAWYGKTWGDGTVPAKSLKPNAWGLYGMHGNVWEWVWDRYAPYPDGTQIDPHGPSDNNALLMNNDDTKTRSLRGGAFGFRAGGVRCAFRGWGGPGVRVRFDGLRVVRRARRQL